LDAHVQVSDDPFGPETGSVYARSAWRAAGKSTRAAVRAIANSAREPSVRGGVDVALTRENRGRRRLLSSASAARDPDRAVAPEGFRPLSCRTTSIGERSESGGASELAAPFINERVTRSPKLLVLWAIGLVGVVAAATTVALALTNDEVDHVGIRAFLNDWITVNYIAAGLIAWWRRPDSRFGLLMVAAGFVNFLATLDWATADVPFTIGFALDMLAPVLFLPHEVLRAVQAAARQT
jgi:hypothetical protein